AGESAIEHERARSRDLEQEIARYRQQVATMGVRAGGLQRQLSETTQAVQTAEDHHRQVTRLFAEGERELTDLIERLDQIRGQYEQHRTSHMEQMRASAELGSQISGRQSEVAATLAALQRNETQTADLDQQLQSLAADLEQLHVQHEQLFRRADQRSQQHQAASDRLADLRRQCTGRQTHLAELEQRKSGLSERASVLEELEKRHEGISPGVKEVLARARSADDGPFRRVRGLVADLLQVNVEAAVLVDVALGEAAQHVVVASGGELLEYLQAQAHTFAGRVAFVWLDKAVDPPLEKEVNLEGRPGVLGRADRFVQTDPEHGPLAKRLLGRTWIVEKLAHALALADSDGAGLDYVTVAGQRLAADGTLTVGPRNVATGLISRRSELRALKSQLIDLEVEIGTTRAGVEELGEQVDQGEQQVKALADQHQEAVDALGEHDHKIIAADERRTQLDRQRTTLETELQAAAARHATLSQSLDDARTRQKEVDSELADTEARLVELSGQRDRLEADRQSRDHNTTEAKVELAKSEERLRNLRVRMHQLQESQQERRRAIAESGDQLARCRESARQSQWSILRRESEVAELYLHKEAYARQTVDWINRREALQEERSRSTAAAQRARSKARKLEEGIHAKELKAGEVRHERSSLAARLREDYRIELAELEHDPSEEEQHQRDEVQQEIDELRRKINNIGNVNLEALEELEEQEARHTTLASQYKDLSRAKASLERIIDKINVDSRRLFSETLETVKGHFATLFRDLFGGGQADIILDDEEDILETGIEIVARPPGKEPRSISLLSGGEKTLTCVALLLAIFRSRPSPFCVLDEVDAALDEANIDRFIQVLQDFLGWTQFIIVTHSKKTMTCANTIYGVTMQESGVSKQVSVRFEDVSEEGEILIPPEADAPPPQADDDETQAA
ncbi:MAG: AAA family ATPase, partial [Planctomycetes bacterium]|nr:AAA family ATPase [Planctomycetota bacterium]